MGRFIAHAYATCSMTGTDLFALFRRLDVQHLQRQGRRRQSGNFGLIVGRGDFHHVHPDDVQVLQAARSSWCAA